MTLYVREGSRFVKAEGRSDVIETGFWCHYEGFYFSDESEIEGGHYGYPCGEDLGRGIFGPHVVSTVAIVKIGDELGQGD